jgi:hypothetical protein
MSSERRVAKGPIPPRPVALAGGERVEEGGILRP